MPCNPRRRWHQILAGCVLSILGSCSSRAADVVPAAPKTIADAAKMLDLAEFPLTEGAETPQTRSLAALSYKTAGNVKDVFVFQRKHLADNQWKELPGGFESDQSSNGTFMRDGFVRSVSVHPAGQPGAVSVTISNHGNLQLDKLPVPADAKALFASPVMAMLTTDSPVDKTAAACRGLLLENGWQPYGQAGDAQFFKRDAIKLTAFISSAPAQGGKTMIQYSAVLMSFDLPAPADAIDVRYADLTATLSFDTEASAADVVNFYKTTLGKAGWQATTDEPFQSDSKKEMIFRNPAKDMRTLEMVDVNGKNRVLLKHQTAAEIAELERSIKEKAAEKKKAKEGEQGEK